MKDNNLTKTIKDNNLTTAEADVLNVINYVQGDVTLESIIESWSNATSYGGCESDVIDMEVIAHKMYGVTPIDMLRTITPETVEELGLDKKK